LRRAFQWILIGLAALVVAAGLVVAYVAATFDPNDYKDRIVEAVQKKTGRTLNIEGDLALSIFPSIGAKLGKTSLSEPKGTKQFAAVESAVVAVKLLPLLSKHVIVDAIELKGLRLDIERDRSGRMNFEDLAGAGGTDPSAKTAEGSGTPEAGTPVKVDIARIAISDADVTFTDQAAGTRYRLSKLDLETGRVASGISTPVELSANIAAEKDKAQMATRLSAMLTFDLERQRYRLDKLDLSAKGDYAGIAGLKAAVKGSIEARTQSGEYIANALTVNASGKRADGSFDLKLDVPKLTLTRDNVAGGKIVLDATSSDPKGKLNAKLRIENVSGAFSAVKAAPFDADIEAQGSGRAYKAQLRGALTANLDKKTAGLDFTGKVDESNVKGQAAVTRFSPLALTFDLEADQLNADKLLGRAPTGQATARPTAAKPTPSGGAPGGQTTAAKQAKASDVAEDETIDLSILEGVDAAGNIRVGKLILSNIRSEDVRATIKAAHGRLDVAPVSARLYQGTLGGSLSVQAGKQPAFTIRPALNGVAVGPLLRDAAQIDTLEGKGAINANLTTRGATVQALKKALNGTASVNLADGSVKGIDIAGTIRAVRAKIDQLQGRPVQSTDKTRKTDFTELKASFKVANGVAHNDDLALKSPLLRLEGAGDIDIGEDRLHYLLKATLVATTKGQGGQEADELAGITVPVQLTGALDSPQWSVDVGGMAASLAKKKVQEEILKRVPGADKPGSEGSLEDAIKNRLEGLFRR
jgi:AsmA protein